MPEPSFFMSKTIDRDHRTFYTILQEQAITDQLFHRQTCIRTQPES